MHRSTQSIHSVVTDDGILQQLVLKDDAIDLSEIHVQEVIPYGFKDEHDSFKPIIIVYGNNSSKQDLDKNDCVEITRFEVQRQTPHFVSITILEDSIRFFVSERDKGYAQAVRLSNKYIAERVDRSRKGCLMM